MAEKDLDSIIKGINDKYLKGKDATPIVTRGDQLAERLKPKFLSTGYYELDKVLGGGYVRGCVTSLWGAPGGGKTALACMAAKECLEEGGTVVWVLAEDVDPPAKTAETVGLDLRSKNFYLIDVKTHGEQILGIIKEMLFDSTNRITRNFVDLIVIDSINCLIPESMIKAIDKNGLEASTMATRARMLSQWLSELAGRGMLREGCTMIAIAHQSVNIGQKTTHGIPYKMTGGSALEHLSKIIIKVAKKSLMIKNKVSYIGHNVIATVTKNNIMGCLGECAYTVIYNKGIDDSTQVIQEAMDKGYFIKLKGPMHAIYTEDGYYLIKGVNEAKKVIVENLDIKEKVKEAMKNNFPLKPIEELQQLELPVEEESEEEGDSD